MPYKIRNLWTPYAILERFPKVFTPEECQKIVKTYMKAGGTHTEINIKGNQHRSSEVSWIQGNDQTATWIFERLERQVMKWNAANFNFDITECSDLQLTCYRSGQFYDWHADLGQRTTSGRKISSIVMLSPPEECEGGTLECFIADDGVRAITMDRGELITFASWVRHRVTEVKTGMRWSLVAWWSGPPLR